jgi:hypothetical protein
MKSLVRTPSPPARTIDHTFPRSAPFFISSSCHDVSHRFLLCRCRGSCEFVHYACPCGVPWPRRPYCLAFDRWPDLVLQNDGIDTVPALHTTEGLDMVFTGVMQVVIPLAHEQARATSAGSRQKLLARRMGPKGLPTSDLFHRSAAFRFFWLHSPFHDSASRLLVRCDVYVALEWHCVLSPCCHCSAVT